MKKYFAELVGTFVLVFGGIGSAVFAGKHIGFEGVAFAFGLSLLAMVYTIGPISGCHINPAVTFGVLLSRKIGGKDAVMYFIAQILGAIIAAALILAIARGIPGGYYASVSGLGANGFGAHSPDLYNMQAAFIAEVIMTAFLVLTVLGATDIKAPVGFAGLAIGLVLTLIHLVGIPIDNTFGELSAQHRACSVRWRMGSPATLALHCCATHWSCGRRRHLCSDSHSG